ncbi:hypothetical protein N0V90_006935 [Kalmusia sp. IMI 367209]|nr:hypothetical protein N0V90_006935 [Kalmusia sp. IMI 367209]
MSHSTNDLLQAFSTACSTHISANASESAVILRGYDIICKHHSFAGLVPVSIVNQSVDNVNGNAGLSGLNFEVRWKQPFLRLRDCYILDHSGRQRPILVGFLEDLLYLPDKHGVIELIYPETNNETHNATYVVINKPDEYSRMHLSGPFASIILGDRVDDIAAWAKDRRAVGYGWRSLAIVVEFLFLRLNVPSLLLNWETDAKIRWLQEACKRVGDSAEAYVAKDGEDHSKSIQISTPQHAPNNTPGHLSQRVHHHDIEVKKARGKKPRLILIIRLERARLAAATHITYNE